MEFLVGRQRHSADKVLGLRGFSGVNELVWVWKTKLVWFAGIYVVGNRRVLGRLGYCERLQQQQQQQISPTW